MPLRALAAAAASLALGGWITYWDFESGLRRVEASPGAYADVFLFAGQLDRQGRPELSGSGIDWPKAVARVRAAGARPWLTIVNDRAGAPGEPVTLKDAEIVGAVLGDAAAARDHRGRIVALARQIGVSGVDLDYENLPASERDRYTAFVRALAGDLRESGLALSVTVQPKTGDVRSRGPGAADWGALCAAADRVQVMLYNEHNASTEPGPIASRGWIDRVLDFGAEACPPSRLVPVLKVSGMDWGPRSADWVTYAEASERARRREAKLRRERSGRQPWFAYDAADGRHVVYFEDAKSLSATASVLRRRGHRAVVLWSLGAEDPETARRIAQNR